MSTLRPAHRGYEYQDLLVACRLVDVLLGSLVSTHVDEQFVPTDRFDDLTTVDANGRRERVQIKYTDSVDRALALNTFTGDSRGLKLSSLVSTALKDRQKHGVDAEGASFRVVLPDICPTDRRLLAALTPAEPDPGPFVRGMTSSRMAFSPDVLWGERETAAPRGKDNSNPFSFLHTEPTAVNRDDLDWVCRHLIVELNAPSASLNLVEPGPAEELLLRRVRDEVGAGAYPNVHRSPTDVATALLDCARAARNGTLTVTAPRLLRRARLRTDFGSVPRKHPVDQNVEILRRAVVSDLLDKAIAAADQGNVLLLVGPPGQGKSWICHQLVNRLSDTDWSVAEHYCYLGDLDGERLPRVLAESIFGSLLERLSSQDPGIVARQRPRFAATKEALSQALQEALRRVPSKRIALVVDGLDHVTRVLDSRSSDPSLELAEELAALTLPTGCALIVLSQPGAHLEPLERLSGSTHVRVPSLTDGELERLAVRLGVIRERGDTANGQGRPARSSDTERRGQFLAGLSLRSSGNALYATYLCKEVQRDANTMADPAATIRSLPQFDGSLAAYYDHLQASLGADGSWVADVIALLDFAISASELKNIRPTGAHRVDRAIEVLRPVLSERAGQGLRIYHESFARYLRLEFGTDERAVNALLDDIISWLEGRGLFADSRAYRHLLPLFHERKMHKRVIREVSHDFVVRSIAHGFPASATTANLVVALRSAASVDDWPAIVRYVEMSRAAETYQHERFESTVVAFADVVGTLLGADTLAERLLHDGRPIMAARPGLQMCAALDAMEAVPPWREYMAAFIRESKDDNTSYGDESNQSVSLAWLRGRLRLAPLEFEHPSGHPGPPRPNALGAGDDRLLHEPVNAAKLAKAMDEGDLSAAEVVEVALDTCGYQAVVALIGLQTRPGPSCLTLAMSIAAGEVQNPDADSLYWAEQAVACGLPPGELPRLIGLGVDLAEVDPHPVEHARTCLLDLTRQVRVPPPYGETDQLREWIDRCAVAARRDPFGLATAEALLAEDSWYTLWLRFTMVLARAEATRAGGRPQAGVDALRRLLAIGESSPDLPRVIDLHSIQPLIESTILRALNLLDDATWGTALDLFRRLQAAPTTAPREVGGLLSLERLFRLAVDRAPLPVLPSMQALLNGVTERPGVDGYYSDFAERRLLKARFALRMRDQSAAHEQWMDACQLLAAYGWRKDATIFELLDSIPSLLLADRARGREAVASVQPLCERVVAYTDGKGTYYAQDRWWHLLADADPCALSRLVQPRLLGSCNSPNPLLHDARSHLWRSWYGEADPLIAAALRLTLEEPLDSADPCVLQRLTEEVPPDDLDEASRLLVFLLARADERPFTHGASNDDELLGQDNELVDQMNLVAANAGGPRIGPLPRASHEEKTSTQSPSRWSRAEAPWISQLTPVFSHGAAGLAEATRAWHDNYHAGETSTWTVDRFANVLGYRLLELDQTGQQEAARRALQSAADSTGFDDRQGLLKALAEGLECHGLTDLAATAHSLAWTRRRGGGGWLTFGGETNIRSLRRATDLDSAVARRTVASEVERFVSRELGTLGITRALLCGFLKADLSTSDSVAFDAWVEGFETIADRLPRVAGTDDTDLAYTAPDPDSGAKLIDDIDVAFVAAAAAGLAHPGREQKRRSLLATQVLIDCRPLVVASVLPSVLSTLSDPATLTWLLRAIELAGAKAAPIIAASRQVLLELAEAPFLTVRVLARRLLGDRDVPACRPTEPDPELVRGGPTGLVLPSGADSEQESSKPRDVIVKWAAGERLSHSEHDCPGLLKAVHRRVYYARQTDEHRRRIEAQRRAYADQIRKRTPDVFSAGHEAVEDAIQRSAAGVRGARLMNGQPVRDPLQLEEHLAQSLLDDPRLPLALERTRQPRPELPFPPARDSPVWADLGSEGSQGRTLELLPAEALVKLVGGPYDHWLLLASLERRWLPRREWEDKEYDIARRFRIAELRVLGDQRGLNSPPIMQELDWTWGSLILRASGAQATTASRPLVGSDVDVRAAGDAREGLGIDVELLTPSQWLLCALQARGCTDFVVEDGDGPVLALITWRTEYETSDHYLAWPRLRGSGLAIRSDAFNRFLETSKRTLVLRDFVAGSHGLCS